MSDGRTENGNHKRDQIVFVVDDDPLIGEALVQLLSSEGITAQPYSSAQAFLDAYRPGQPGCLLLDIGMPDIDGLELQALLAENRLRIPIVFLSGSANVSKTIQAFNRGAIDFLEKPAGKAALLERIRKALATDYRLRAQEIRQSSIQARYDRLTPRERRVMGLTVAGYSSKEMALKLRISHRTIEGYRRRILEKMRTKSLLTLRDMSRGLGTVELDTTDF